MKFKKLIALIALFMILAGVSIVKKMNLEKRDAALDAPSPKVSLAKGISAGFVRKVVVSKGTDEKNRVEIVKNDAGEWTVISRFGARGRKDQVDAVIKNVIELSGEVRSDSKEVLSDYLISDEQAIGIEFYGTDEKAMTHLYVGALRPAEGYNFVRLAGTAQVIVAPSDLLAAVGVYNKDSGPDYKIFTDMQAVKFETANAQKIEILGGSSVMLVKTIAQDKSALWAFEPSKNEAIDPPKVDAYLAGVVNLYAWDLLSAEEDYGFEAKPFVRVTYLKGEERVAAELYAGKRNEANQSQIVKVMPDNKVYEISASSVDSLKKDKAFFIASNTGK